MRSEFCKTIPYEIEYMARNGTASTSQSIFVDKERRLLNKNFKLLNNIVKNDDDMKMRSREFITSLKSNV